MAVWVWFLRSCRATLAIRLIAWVLRVVAPKHPAGVHWAAFTVCFIGLMEEELALQRHVKASFGADLALERIRRAAFKARKSSGGRRRAQAQTAEETARDAGASAD